MNVDHEAVDNIVRRVGQIETIKKVSILDANGTVIQSTEPASVGSTVASGQIGSIQTSRAGVFEIRNDPQVKP